MAPDAVAVLGAGAVWKEGKRMDAIDLIEELAMRLDGIPEGRLWDSYVGLCAAAGRTANRDLLRDSRPSEPIGIGPGGYDPMKDTDVTGV